jgi:hypothetical protein
MGRLYSRVSTVENSMMVTTLMWTTWAPKKILQSKKLSFKRVRGVECLSTPDPKDSIIINFHNFNTNFKMRIEPSKEIIYLKLNI